MALILQIIEECQEVLIAQFIPVKDELSFAPRNIGWKTHYATYADDMIYCPLMKTPMKLREYITKAFPKQLLRICYYTTKSQRWFPENAIRTEEITI